MRWLACELHTHTLHSDGSQTLEELASGAARLGFDAIALTDHNTMSGLVGRERIERQTGLRILPGMEWTTFYGHMVTIGLSTYADWRQAERGGIDEGLKEVHRLGGLAGLAHPFRIGSPACTGCFWEYEIKDWTAVDYIEVWSGTSPSIQTDNRRAFELWTDKLNEGYRIAATSGRDWHNQNETEEPISVTYLGIARQEAADRDAGLSPPQDTRTEADVQALVGALRAGRASVTIGPLLTMTVESGGQSYGLGSVIPVDSSAERNTSVRRTNEEESTNFDPAPSLPPIRVHLTLDFSVRSGLWSLPEQTLRLKLCSNRGEEHTSEVRTPEGWTEAIGGAEATGSTDTRGEALMEFVTELSFSADCRWLRAELWGTVRGAYVRIAFTNAIYVESAEGASRL